MNSLPVNPSSVIDNGISGQPLRKLVRSQPSLLALEQRFMFDGAAVDTALAAADTTHVELPPAALIESTVESAASAPVIARDLTQNEKTAVQLSTALEQSRQALRVYFSEHSSAEIFTLFNGQQAAPSGQWLAAAERLRDDVLAGRYDVALAALSNAEIGGVFGGFAAEGPGGAPTIFINRDWIEAGASEAAISRVLIEEIGHSIDHALNGMQDTAGDEGEAFAAAVLRLDVSDAERLRIAAEDDHASIVVDGRVYEIEEASITFTQVFKVTPDKWSVEAQGFKTDAEAINGAQFKFTSADSSDLKFSGNNVLGTLSYLDNNGSVSFFGEISRLVKDQGVVKGLYFYVPGADGTIGTTDDSAYVLSVVVSNYFTGGESHGSSSDSKIATELNALMNSAPAGTDKAVTLMEDQSYSFVAADFGFTDTLDSPANSLKAVFITTVPALGSLKFNGNTVTAGDEILAGSLGQLTFTPAADQSGVAYASFTFQVRDDGDTANGGIDLDASPNMITFNVTPVSDAPAGTDKAVTLLEDQSYSFVAADFGFIDAFDSPANSLKAVFITTVPALGSLKFNGNTVTAGDEILAGSLGQLTFTPAADQSGIAYASFTFQVRDDGDTANGGIDLDASPNMITFNVTNANDAPAGTDKAVTLLEDQSYSFVAADFGFIDAFDSPANSLKAVFITTVPALGSLKFNGNTVTAGDEILAGSLGQLTFTPAADQSGIAYASFTFQVRDDGDTANGGINLDPTPNMITFNVTNANDAPIANSDTAIAVEAGGIANGTPGINPSGNVLSNDTDADNPANPDPQTVVSASGALTATKDVTTATGIEGNYGTLVLSLTGAYTYTVNNNNATVQALRLSTDTLSDSFAYTMRDTDGLTSLSTLTITIQGANDAPVAIADTAAATEAGGIANGTPGVNPTGNVLTNDTDPDAVDTQTVVLASGALMVTTDTSIAGSYGTLLLSSTGAYTYTVNNNNATVQALNVFDSLTETFTYTLQDTAGLAATTTLTVTINGATDSVDSSLPPTLSSPPPPQSGTPPPQSGTPPPQSGTPPPQSGTPPPQSGTPPPSTPVPPTLTITNTIVTEGQPAIFIVSSDTPLLMDVSFTPTPADGTAKIGRDTEENNKLEASNDDGKTWKKVNKDVVTITKGTSSVQLRIATIDDAIFESPETFTLLTGAISGTVTNAAGVSGTATITDNDLRLNDVTISEASPYAIFIVDGTPGQSISLALQGGTEKGKATIGNDAGSTLEYFDGAWKMYSNAVIMPVDGKLLVRVAIINDKEFEGSESFSLVATNPAGTQFFGIGMIKDDGSSANVFEANQLSATPAAGIADDDRLLSVNDINISEASPFAVFTVRGQSGQFVALLLESDTATIDKDTGSILQYFDGENWVRYVANSHVAIPAGGNTLLVRVAINNDDSHEGPESFRLKAVNTGGRDFTGTATIFDDGSNGKVFAEDNRSGVPSDGIADDDRPKLGLGAPPPLPEVGPVNEPIPAPAPVAPIPVLLEPVNDKRMEAPAVPVMTIPEFTPLGFGEMLTRAAGFRIVVAEGATPRLSLNRAVTDQFVEANRASSFTMPADAFSHTRADATIMPQATLANGEALPDWIVFDARTGTFKVIPPPNFHGKLEIKFTVRDNEGREASTMFRLFVGGEKISNANIPGRSSFSELLRQAGRHGAAWPGMRDVGVDKGRSAVMPQRVQG